MRSSFLLTVPIGGFVALLISRLKPRRRLSGNLVNWQPGRRPTRPFQHRPIDHIVYLTVGMGGLGIVGLVVSSPMLVVTAAGLTVIVPPQLLRSQSRSEREAALAELPNLVDLLIAEVRSGRSIGDALLRLDEVIDLGGARRLIAPLINSIRSGVPLRQSLDCLTTSNEPPLRLLGAGLQVLATSGGPVAPALGHIRHTLTGSVHERREVRAQASQARASASVLSLAPVLFALLAATADHSLAAFYLFELKGAACVLSSLVLTGVGWRWMMAMTENCGDES